MQSILDFFVVVRQNLKFFIFLTILIHYKYIKTNFTLLKLIIYTAYCMFQNISLSSRFARTIRAVTCHLQKARWSTSLKLLYSWKAHFSSCEVRNSKRSNCVWLTVCLLPYHFVFLLEWQKRKPTIWCQLALLLSCLHPASCAARILLILSSVWKISARPPCENHGFLCILIYD